MIYKMDLKDSVDTMTFNLLETPIVDKDIEGAVDNVTLDGNQYTDYLYLKKQYIQKWAIMCPDEYDELRGFYTRQFEEGEVPSYRVYYGANVTRDYTLNGDYLQFNAEGIETGMTLSQFFGNAEQTTYSGKNLARPNGNNTAAGVSFVWNSDGTITLNGTSTVAIDVWVANGGSGATEFTIPTGTKLTQSFRVVSGSASANTWTIRTNLYYGGTSHWSDVVGNTTFTATSETQVRGLEVLAPSSGLTFNNLRLEIQLEKSATATTWERYVGGIPAPNPSYPQSISTVTGGQTVRVCGENQQSTTWGQDFVDAINDASKASVQTYDGKNCLKYAVSAGYGSYPTNNFTLGIKFQPSTQYTFSFDMLKTNAQARTFAIWYSDGTYTTTNTGDAGADEWHHYEITSTAGKTVMYATPFYTAGDAYIDIDTFQIEIGTSASQFVPYYGQELEVNLGKNLTDLSTFTFGYVTSTGEIQVSHLMGEMVSPFVKVEPNTAYTFKIFKTTGTNQGWFGVGEYTSESTSSFIRRDTNTVITATSITFTTSATTNYVRVSARNLEQATKVQLEKGSTSTSWAEYFTPIELAKVGTYQDRIYKDGGKWYIEKQVGKVTFDGSSDESWALGTTGSLRYPFGIDIVGKGWTSSSIDGVMCDTFTLSVSSEAGIAEQYQFTYRGTSYNNRMWFFCPKSAITGSTSAEILASYKTFLSSHPTTVYYALATPTTTEITDETLLLQLNFLASLYKGENNISLVGTGAQGEMEVFIRDVMSVETDVVPEVPVRLTLTDDGVINACGCRRNVQLTMRETVQ